MNLTARVQRLAERVGLVSAPPDYARHADLACELEQAARETHEMRKTLRARTGNFVVDRLRPVPPPSPKDKPR